MEWEDLLNARTMPDTASVTVNTMTEMCEATAQQWLTIFDSDVPGQPEPKQLGIPRCEGLAGR